MRKVRMADEHDLEKKIKALEMLLEDNGDQNFKQNAKEIAKMEHRSQFEKAIDENIEKNNPSDE